MTDLLVLGSGVAGLSAALHARAAGRSVLVLTKGELSHSATWYAQGGVAAALGEPDSPELHFRDTVVAGAGLVRRGRRRRPRARRARTAFASWPRSARGSTTPTDVGCSPEKVVTRSRGSCTPAATRPAPRSSARSSRQRSRRVARSARDGSRSRCSSSTVRPRAWSRSTRRGIRSRCARPTPCIATGGAGQCYAVTTNPALSTGDGIALALRAGVACADMEFVQFHPTALHHPAMPRPLLSEALRGEGAVLRDATRRRVHARRAPARRPRAARCRCPRDPRAHARRRRRSPLARRDDDRRLRRPVPDDLERVPDRRSRPDARVAAGRARRALPLGRRARRSRRRDDDAGPLGVR